MHKLFSHSSYVPSWSCSFRIANWQENPSKTLVSLAQGDPTCYPHLRPSVEMVSAVSHAVTQLATLFVSFGPHPGDIPRSSKLSSYQVSSQIWFSNGFPTAVAYRGQSWRKVNSGQNNGYQPSQGNARCRTAVAAFFNTPGRPTLQAKVRREVATADKIIRSFNMCHNPSTLNCRRMEEIQ